MSQKTIVIIDASSLKNSHCILKFFNDTYIGYREYSNDSVLVWGSAFHKFRAYYRETKQALAALKIAQNYWSTTPMTVKDNKKYLNSTFLTDACLQYEVKYENDSFETIVNPHTKKNLIEPETRFAFPFIVEDDIEILCAGTMDEIGKWRGGKYCIVDCKTSATWKIREFFLGYKLDPQMLMYRWTLKKYAELHPDSIWAKIERTDPGCFIDGVFYKCADKENSTPTVTFTRSEIMQFKESQLQEFEMMLKLQCQKLIHQIRIHKKLKSYQPMKEGIINGTCKNFGLCKYFGACSAPDIEASDSVLERSFKREQYNPLKF